MDAIREKNATLVDLLDRVLDKGLVLSADLIISVSGIPLIGLNLRAAIAGIDTMLEYGMWNNWDEAQRISATKEHQRLLLDRCLSEKDAGDNILLETFGSYWHHDGIYNAWRPGQVILTGKGLKISRKVPFEILFSADYGDIDGIATETGTNTGGEETEYYSFFLKDGAVAKIHVTDQSCGLIEMCRDEMKRAGYTCKTFQPQSDTPADIVLAKNEKVLCQVPMWHLAEGSSVSAESGDIWKPGRIYVTSEQLIWHYAFDEYYRSVTRLDAIRDVTITVEKISTLLKSKELLNVTCRDGTRLLFSGNQGLVPQVADALHNLLPETVDRDSDQTVSGPEIAVRI